MLRSHGVTMLRQWKAWEIGGAWRQEKRCAGTGLVLLNMGGPATANEQEVEGFLRNLFSDRDIVRLPFQAVAGPLLARRRAPKVAKLYAEIGGSPILKWTVKQAELLTTRLDLESPDTGPHKAFVGFRYVQPRVREALVQMRESGVKRAVAFSQYPHFSCTTAGSSLNELWRELRALGLENAFQWSLVDRWPLHGAFLHAVSTRIQEAVARFPVGVNLSDIHVLFSAHSIPVETLLRGDHYPGEVTASVHAIMHGIRAYLPAAPQYHICWQSKVGPRQWLAPHTDAVIKALAARGVRNLLVVPIAFTTDHIETLSEIDIEYAHLAKKHGITNFIRSESLNDADVTIRALADVVKDHLRAGLPHSPLYLQRCPECVNPECRAIVNPISR